VPALEEHTVQEVTLVDLIKAIIRKSVT